ncbi:Cytochrome P450 [Dillenia turbinata]|uniref:Cytochrome P450 n=1 Tax=Dillenia turbinata TaxID=194707 RepID=A0AAN8ZRC1_9MAGN
MELAWNFIVWCVICFSPILIRLLHRRKAGNYPAGPWGLPIVGNMLDIAGTMPHRNIAKMNEKYGPVIGLKVGAVRTVAITSAKTAAVLFKNYDLDFVDRAIVDSMKCHDLHKTILGLAPYGTFWRVLKRIYAVDLLLVKRLNETVPVRRKCVDQMLAWIDEEALNPHPIDVGRFMYLTAFNIIGSLVLFRQLLDPNSKEGTEFFEMVSQMVECAAKPNISDAFPWLSWLDLQGVRRRMNHVVGEALRIASGFVKERMEGMSKEVVHNRPRDFLDVLIEFDGDGKNELTKLSEHEINILVLGLFIAGSETNSSITEWVLTELLYNPEESVDADRIGMTARKAVPLMAIPKKCAT